MADIDQDEVNDRAEELQKMYKKPYLAMRLQEELDRDEPIKSLDMQLCSELVALFEQINDEAERDEQGRFK